MADARDYPFDPKSTEEAWMKQSVEFGPKGVQVPTNGNWNGKAQKG
jgi:hypothetical protein